MVERITWVKKQMNCPEGRGETELFAEWRHERGVDTLNSICCNNPLLRDLSGTDCRWSCWDRVAVEKR
jgi:hypothetical protein